MVFALLSLSALLCAIDSPECGKAWDAVFLRACEHTNRSDPAAGYWSGKDACMALMLLG